MKKLEKLNTILIICLLVLTIFSTPLKSLLNINFNYSDELLTIYILCICIYKFIKKELVLSKNDMFIIFLLVLIDLIGLIGNIVSKYQTSLFAILVDVLGWQKLVVTYIGFKDLINKSKVEKYYEIINIISKIIIILGCIFEVLNLFNIVVLAPEHKRFGINAFSIMGHPSMSCAIFAFIICWMLREPQKNMLWIIISLLLEIATLRTKAFAFCGAVILCYIFSRDNKKLVAKLICLGSVMLLIAMSSIKFYFLDPNASRAKALNVSIKIANSMFPVGSGFGTYGSKMAGEYYSSVYEKYELSNIYGFTENNSSFIGDGGWATIIGQFGYIGTALFVIILCLIVKNVINKHTEIQKLVPFICIMIYFLISSTNEPAINNSYIVFLGLFASMLEIENSNRIEEKQNGF